jgi:hypothetical protein
MADAEAGATVDERLMELQTDDAMGKVEPETKDNLLGEKSLGDGASVGAGDPKIVASPSNSANEN